MKIYTEIVIDMTTMEVVNEESYEYDGVVAECKGGGGGGGGSSGKVDFPAHMKTVHQDWLNDTGADTMAFSVVDLMNTAMTGSSPYSGYVPKDPDSAFLAPGNTLLNYTSSYEQLKDFYEWDLDAAYDSYFTDDSSKISAAIDAQSDLQEDNINSDLLPRFKSSMVNINATSSSAFVVGKAKIWDRKAMSVAETDANIRLKRMQEQSEIALRRIATYTEWRRLITSISSDLSRMYLQAHGDRDDDYLEGLHKDGVWDLELYQYGTQVMASISGSASTAAPRKSKMAGAVGGAMTGAAIGTQISPGYGTIIGGVAGGIAGYAS